MACRICRLRKVKCDRTRPSCKNCMLRGNQCTYAGERRKLRRPRKLDDGRIDVELVDTNGLPFSGEWDMTSPRPATLNFRPTQVTGRGDAISVPSSTDSVRTPAAESTAHPWQEGLLDEILDGNDVDPLKDCHPAIWMRVGNAEEYSGPSTGIAAISDLGLKWICSQVPESDEICRTIQYVRNGLLTHLRQCIPPQPCPNPEMAAVWKALPPPEIVHKYVDAYFSTVQTIFPVVDPLVFDEMLAQWYQQPTRQSDSWKALLNAVLASGCRAALSNGTASTFKESSDESWGFFQNALNYEPKLVHSATDLLSVQALTVMVVFAQGMSCSQRLEYILCSTAARLAHSLALNRHVPKYWHMSEQEQRERSRLFWVIYCLDKGIALRSGRPPVIQDEDISCPFPRDVRYRTTKEIPPQRQLDSEEPRFDFFYYLAKFYRICSLIAQKLYSTPALCRPASDLRIAADEILARLKLWCESIPEQFRPGQPFSSLPHSCGLLRMQAIVLHFSYYYAVCAVHRRFTPMFFLGKEQEEPEEWPPQGSSVVYIEAARSMALLTRHLDIESYTPAWLLFYYPTTALATIFMHTVTNPLSTSAHSDIALMESVAGFFGRLEFMTLGEAAFTQTCEFARQARRIVARAAEQNRDKSCASGDPNELNRALNPFSRALISDMEDTPSDRRNDHNGIHTSLPAQPTTDLQPMSTSCAGSTRQLDSNCTGSQVNDHIECDSEGEWSPPNPEDTSSNLRNDITCGLDLSFPEVQCEYLLDGWLQANVV